jgi:hypothetical protein
MEVPFLSLKKFKHGNSIYFGPRKSSEGVVVEFRASCKKRRTHQDEKKKKKKKNQLIIDGDTGNKTNN